MIENMDDKKVEIIVEYCDNCGKVTEGCHTCPYNEDINDDYDSLCNCCDDCSYQCIMNI